MRHSYPGKRHAWMRAEAPTSRSTLTIGQLPGTMNTDEFLAMFSAYAAGTVWTCTGGILRENNERQDCPLSAVWNAMHPGESAIRPTNQVEIENAWLPMGLSLKSIRDIQDAADIGPHGRMPATLRQLRTALMAATLLEEKKQRKNHHTAGEAP